MSPRIFSDSEIYIRSYEEALKQNQQRLTEIQTFKKELEDVKTNLEQNQKHLFQNILVPIGSKAYMKGKLVHTNEIMINVGSRWFIKKSAEGAIQTCNRMIERCDENIADYEKEKSFLTTNLERPNDYEIFASGDVQEIIETYDEEEEKQWREKHRENIRAYKQQLAVERKAEEDLFRKLDELEKKEKEEQNEDEEEEEELDEDEDEDDDSDYDEEDIDEEEYEELIKKSILMNELVRSTITPSTPEIAPTSENIPYKCKGKRVSFSDSLENTQEFSTKPLDDEIDIIYFKHSETKNQNMHSEILQDDITSPTDIYRKFLLEVDNINRKSILKKTYSFKREIPELNQDSYDEVFTNENNSYEGNRMEKVQKSIIKVKRNPCDASSSISLNEISSDEVFGDIVEKTPEVLPKVENNTRPVSKFKKSRIGKGATY